MIRTTDPHGVENSTTQRDVTRVLHGTMGYRYGSQSAGTRVDVEK